MASILDGDDSGGEAIEIKTTGIADAAGEVKRRRGRPPGSKNKPKEESILPTMSNAVRGIFMLAALIAGWFGYQQKEELTESEALDGARAFIPIAAKAPWLMDAAVWIGAPVWLIVTMRKKFERKPNANASTRSDSSNRNLSPSAETQNGNPAIGSGQTVGTFQTGR